MKEDEDVQEIAKRTPWIAPEPIDILSVDKSNNCVRCGKSIMDIGDEVPIWIHTYLGEYDHPAIFEESK